MVTGLIPVQSISLNTDGGWLDLECGIQVNGSKSCEKRLIYTTKDKE